MEQAPTSNPGLQANLVCRVILATAGILISWVPFRLLVRNGEFAAVVFILDVALMNLITILNCLIWHDDDWVKWWDGTGLCDVEVYVSAPLQTVYAASIFAVMCHLAQQVKISGVGRGRRDRTRRNLIQATIIFPIPFVQLVFTYFDLAQRYTIGTLIGCTAVYDVSWPKNLVYDAPPAVFALLSVPYAILLWRRYRAIAKQARGILGSGSEASIRANRTRRRLYNMSLLILVVYVPIMMYYLIFNIRDTLSSYRVYDYGRMRWSATPYPWDTILFIPSWVIPLTIMNQPWIPILTSAFIVLFFGTTTEARQMYRQYAEHVRLGTCIRKLRWKRVQPQSPADDSETTRDSGRTLLPNRVRGPVKYHIRERDTIIPTIERPKKVRVTEAQCAVSTPTRTTLKTPPVIPPRYSSLRFSFTFRTPTLQSIRKSIRIPSLRSRAASTSIETTGDVTELDHDDSLPMLPLYNSTRRHEVEADLRPSSGSFLARDIREATSPVPFSVGNRLENSRAESEFQVRVPIAQRRFTAGGRGEHDGKISRMCGRETAGFPREQTLTTIHTLSDTRTNESLYSAGRKASSRIGVAK
ncbi:pheromone A receptor-domain-containing protein [Nemania serpens]|nr:pheromone A receptor-domain-containing protein [Nemania serpens]